MVKKWKHICVHIVYVKIKSTAGKCSIKNGLTLVMSVVETHDGGSRAQIENTNENQRFRMSWKMRGITKHICCSNLTGPRVGLLLSTFNTATKSQVILPVLTWFSSPDKWRGNLPWDLGMYQFSAWSIFWSAWFQISHYPLALLADSPWPPHFVVTLEVHFKFRSGLIYEHMSSRTTQAIETTNRILAH